MSNHFKTENTQITKSEKRETGVSTSFRSQVKVHYNTVYNFLYYIITNEYYNIFILQCYGGD